MQIVPVTDIDIRMMQGRWALPAELRDAVPAYWREATANNPYLWDGRILGLSGVGGAPLEVSDGLLQAEAREDAYSAFMLWRHRGFPPIGLHHVFCWALIVSSDDALIYGVMGGRTANAGRVYPPGGSLEPRDVRPDGSVDVIGAIELELIEETGLRAADAERGMTVAALEGARVSVGQVYRFAEPAAELTERILNMLDRQQHPELAGVVTIRSPDDARRHGAVPYAQAVAEEFAAGAIR